MKKQPVKQIKNALSTIQGLPAKTKALLKEIKQEYTKEDLEYEFLPSAMEIEETPPSPIRRILIWLIFAILIIAFLWSYFGRVDEVAVARGKIVPDGEVKVIQPLEIGVIRAIHVTDGQQVQQGQLLIEIDPTINQADVESTIKNLSIRLTDKQRLQEELTGKSIRLPNAIQKEVPPEVIAFQERLKIARQSEYRAKEDAQRAVVDQRSDSLRNAEATLEKYRKTRDIIREQATAYEGAYKEEYISRMEYLEKQKDLFTTEQEYKAQIDAVEQAKAGVKEAQQTLIALRGERQKSILGDVMEGEKSIASLEGDLVKARKRYELEKLAAPVSGTVHGLQSYTIGGVVTPAQPVVTIVPEGTTLVIEAEAENKDIGFIKVGQTAEIKLDTFPFQKYGTVKGVVTLVSADAFEEKNNDKDKNKDTDKDADKKGLIYKIKVNMEKTSMVVDGRLVNFSPGMAAAVEVKTGRRRIIEFFLSPIIKYAKESLTLR
jgi:hemolysin D